MCYPVCGMVHIKEPLLLMGKSSLCSVMHVVIKVGFPTGILDWSYTISPTLCNCKCSEFIINKTFVYRLHSFIAE